MITKVFGTRTESPAFFDMSARFNPGGFYQIKESFGMGDRAAVHVWLWDWRKNNPHRKLVVIEDRTLSGPAWRNNLRGEWLFSELADELWIVEERGENIPMPPGEAIYRVAVWGAWRGLRDRRISLNPTIRPLPEAMNAARLKLEELKVPDRFITLQPLFDAPFNFYRNGKISWWEEVCENLSKEFPTVVIGDVGNSSRMKVAKDAYPLWTHGLCPMESLAVVSQASVHIGGMTGFTIWAPIFKVPTVAVYRKWYELEENGSIDERPFSFGALVVWSPLEGKVEDYLGITRELWAKRG
jgi:hypothetical protein